MAIDQNATNITKSVVAVGEETRKIEENNNQDILIMCPLRWGVIADLHGTSVKMFEYLIQKALGHKLIFRPKPKIVVCIPKDTTEVEKKAFSDAFY